MFDPNSSAFVPVLLSLLALTFITPAVLIWAVPRLRMRRLERRAAAGDPEAQQSMSFLQDLVDAMNAVRRELYVARLLVGADVPVFVDRADPAALTVGWDRA